MVGVLTPESEAEYGDILAPYLAGKTLLDHFTLYEKIVKFKLRINFIILLSHRFILLVFLFYPFFSADPQNLFVISSDFCHWGQRFRYTYFDESCGSIHKSIEKLDKDVSTECRF